MVIVMMILMMMTMMVNVMVNGDDIYDDDDDDDDSDDDDSVVDGDYTNSKLIIAIVTMMINILSLTFYLAIFSFETFRA